VSLYNVQTTKTELGYEVAIRCLHAKLRAEIDLADDLRGRPDAEAMAVALLAERHDTVCQHRCVDALKSRRPTLSTVESVRLELGAGSLSIRDVPPDALGEQVFLVVVRCPHEARELRAELLPGEDKLEAYMSAARNCARQHRAESGCGCIPDPDDED
jgi:hypothetical protein